MSTFGQDLIAAMEEAAAHTQGMGKVARVHPGDAMKKTPFNVSIEELQASANRASYKAHEAAAAVGVRPLAVNDPEYRPYDGADVDGAETGGE